MASMRVHELAKEFNMSSKDMLDKLHEMKITAKSHASMLAESDVEKVRQNLSPEIKERAGELPAEEAKQLAEERAEAKRQQAEAERARREGLLALEYAIKEVDDEFLRDGLQTAIDGTDPDELYEILSAQIQAKKAAGEPIK